MKQTLSEVKRLQKLAGLLKEDYNNVPFADKSAHVSDVSKVAEQEGIDDRERVLMVGRALYKAHMDGKELSYQGKKIINAASEGFYVEDGSKRGQFVRLKDLLPGGFNDILVDGEPLEVDPEVHSTAALHKRVDQTLRKSQGALYRGDDDDDYGIGPGSRLD